VTAAGRCAAQTQKEAASPPLMSGKKAAAPGLGDAPRKDTRPPLSVKAGCDPRATAGREAAWHTDTPSPVLTLSLRRPRGQEKRAGSGLPYPGRGASDATEPRTSQRQVSKDELAFDSQKKNRNHKKPLTGSVHASRGLPRDPEGDDGCRAIGGGYRARRPLRASQVSPGWRGF
jgi:hypothetical protein